MGKVINQTISLVGKVVKLRVETYKVHRKVELTLLWKKEVIDTRVLLVYSLYMSELRARLLLVAIMSLFESMCTVRGSWTQKIVPYHFIYL